MKGKVLLMLVNEPPSDDPNFFKGKALTYYGRWVYKYEEAARKGAVGAILIHQTDMASYPWEVGAQLELGREVVSQAGRHAQIESRVMDPAGRGDKNWLNAAGHESRQDDGRCAARAISIRWLFRSSCRHTWSARSVRSNRTT